MSKRHKWILMIAVLVLACFSVAPAVSAATFDQGYDAGNLVAMEKFSSGKAGWFGKISYTSPLGMLISYVQTPKNLALSSINGSVSEQYKSGFVCGFCDAVKQKQRTSLKDYRAPARIGTTLRIP